MECKVIKYFGCDFSDLTIGIYPEWNVKCQGYVQNLNARIHWNISRMECKVSLGKLTKDFKIIGIYPEWNVKITQLHFLIKLLQIGIYPEWNVKCTIAIKYSEVLASIGIYPEWNVKFFKRREKGLTCLIGIYPEWNVKISSQVPCNNRSQIGIYPEWNVKSTSKVTSSSGKCIGIYPEWNVKSATFFGAMTKAFDWNISRMECKV